MKKLINKILLKMLICFMVLGSSFTNNTNSGQLYDKGYIDGQLSAQSNHDSTVWLIGSGLISFILPIYFIGPIATNIVAMTNVPDVPLREVIGKEDAYRMGYIDGYRKLAHGKDTTNALIGSGVGFFSSMAIFLSR